MVRLIGPFSQLVTMRNLSNKGPLHNKDLEIIENGAILAQNDTIHEIGEYTQLRKNCTSKTKTIEIDQPAVAIPGMIDCHTHLCFGGSRAADYTMRTEGKSYEEIAEKGGGIKTSVTSTRALSEDVLYKESNERLKRIIKEGITTVEIKSGYGLDVESEIKMLRVIKKLGDSASIDCIPTCLAAHATPEEYTGQSSKYLKYVANQILPKVIERKLAKRADIFIEKGAFSVNEGREYLLRAQKMGFETVIHADQFSVGGSRLAVELNCISADHLEASGEEEITSLASSDTTAVTLPGASLGLGLPFAPARRLLDAGCCVAIASDYNPGSAPMGQLITQSSLIGIYEKLTMAEVLAGITFRAARALNLQDRGRLVHGQKCDITIFPTSDFREILYHQGSLTPLFTVKNGRRVSELSKYGS